MEVSTSIADNVEEYSQKVERAQYLMDQFEDSATSISREDADYDKRLAKHAKRWAPRLMHSYNEAVYWIDNVIELDKKGVDYFKEHGSDRSVREPNKELSEQIEEVNTEFNLLDERKEYISSVLKEDTGKTLEEYAYPTVLHEYADDARVVWKNDIVLNHAKAELRNDPDAMYVAGALSGIAGVFTAQKALNLLSRKDK